MWCIDDVVYTLYIVLQCLPICSSVLILLLLPLTHDSYITKRVCFILSMHTNTKIQTKKSPLVPGQWRSMLTSYSMIYGFAQLLKPIRVAVAIGNTKLAGKYLVKTQTKLNCSREIAIAVMYMMGWVIMGSLVSFGVMLASLITGVSIFG